MDTCYYTHKNEDFVSSSLESLHYDEPTKVLYVEFCSGTIIAYRDVPMSVWIALNRSASKGSAYNNYVKGKFNGLGINFNYDDLVKRQPTGLEAIGMTPQAFTVSAVVKVSRKVVAPTMEAAIEQFKKDNPDSTVTEVTVSFV